MNPFIIFISLILAFIIIGPIIGVIALIIILQRKDKNKSQTTAKKPIKYQQEISYQPMIQQPIQKFPYKKKYLFSKNEYYFYKGLNKLTEKYNLEIFIKMRLADIIEVDLTKVPKSEYMRYFGKIKAKHIDFVLCDKDTLKLIAAIELDDNSHKQEKRIERDEFVNKALTLAGVNLIRCKGINIVEEHLQNIMNIPNIQPSKTEVQNPIQINNF